MDFRKSLLISLTCALLSLSESANAENLVGVKDTDLKNTSVAFLTDTSLNWAIGWTQSISSFNVSVSAVLDTNVGAVPANWWITDVIGPETTSANVIYSGQYIAPELKIPDDLINFNSAPMTVLAKGLDFRPGTYYLVIDGAPGPLPNNTGWVGSGNYSYNIKTHPGFSLGNLYYSSFYDTKAVFGPSSTFDVFVPGYMNSFSLNGAVPEPETWSLLITGFGIIGGAFRSRRPRSNLKAA